MYKHVLLLKQKKKENLKIVLSSQQPHCRLESSKLDARGCRIQNTLEKMLLLVYGIHFCWDFFLASTLLYKY